MPKSKKIKFDLLGNARDSISQAVEVPDLRAGRSSSTLRVALVAAYTSSSSMYTTMKTVLAYSIGLVGFSVLSRKANRFRSVSATAAAG